MPPAVMPVIAAVSSYAVGATIGTLTVLQTAIFVGAMSFSLGRESLALMPKNQQ